MSYVVCDNKHKILAFTITKIDADRIAMCLSDVYHLVYIDNADEDFVTLYCDKKCVGTLSKRGVKNESE